MNRLRVALALALGLAAGAVNGQQPAAPQEGGASLADLVDRPRSAEEERLRGEIQARIAADAQSAALRKRWRYISPTDAAMLALQRNLPMRLAGRQPALAEEALREARALFAPVIEVNVAHSRTNLGNRTITAEINRLSFVQGACQPIPLPPGAANNGRPNVTQICFAVRGSNQQLTGPVMATPPSDTQPGTDKVTSLFVGLTQRLPWGAQLRLSQTTVHNPTYYLVSNQYFTYGAPYAANIFGQLTLPLPGTRGFGALAPAEFGIALAEKARERAFWDVKDSVNSVLLQVDLAYWQLVQAAQTLGATLENRRLVESLGPSFERRYNLETMSRFDKAQTDAELARAKVEEEIALRSFFIASTSLASLVEDDPARLADSILFPVGFGAGAPSAPPALEQIQDASLKQRADLVARRIDREVARLNVRFAENQALRDISLDVSAVGTQNASIYGYKTLTDALRHSPDQESFSGALTFTNPWGRRAARAAVSSANANSTATDIAERVSVNAVLRDVNDAFAAYASAQRRVENARDALKLSEFAHDQVQRRFDIGEYVSQVELNRNRRDVLAARLALINAEIDLRRAQSRLLGAQGVLASRYPGLHAWNEFERHRLAMLAQAKVLRFFAEEAR